MPRSKDFSEEVRRKVVEAHEAGKGYKTISKMCDLHHSTVRKIIYKWKAFNTISTRPRSGRPTKMATILRQLRRGSRTVLSGGVGASGEKSEQASENENRQAEAVSVGAEGEGDTWGSGPGCAGLAAGEEDEASVTLVLPDDPALTRKTTKRIRRKDKMKDLELKSNRDPGSAPSSAERHMDVMLCCEICGTCFTTETDLESHQAQHLDKTLHECEECGKAFQSAAGLRAHRKRKHGC